MSLKTDDELAKRFGYDIAIPVGSDTYLVATRNLDPEYSREIFVGLVDGRGCWFQDLACIRNAYGIYDGYEPVWQHGVFETLVYSCEFDDDYTHKFTILERKDYD